jgi:hypothetical protein
MTFVNWLRRDWDALPIETQQNPQPGDHNMKGEGGRTVGAFRRAMEKIEAASKAGNIDGKRELAGGQLQAIDGEFNAHEINFARGTLNGERVLLSRESILKLREPPAPPQKLSDGRPPKPYWNDVETALEQECLLQASIPYRGHSDPEWQTVADATEWVKDYLTDRKRRIGKLPGKTALYENVGPMLERIAARMKQKSGN